MFFGLARFHFVQLLSPGCPSVYSADLLVNHLERERLRFTNEVTNFDTYHQSSHSRCSLTGLDLLTMLEESSSATATRSSKGACRSSSRTQFWLCQRELSSPCVRLGIPVTSSTSLLVLTKPWSIPVSSRSRFCIGCIFRPDGIQAYWIVGHHDKWWTSICDIHAGTATIGARRRAL